ncbi:MAG: hypothetical protein AVDCRST_MAG19-2952, partial [uncultured Thermomicrobiales bacterium]
CARLAGTPASPSPRPSTPGDAGATAIDRVLHKPPSLPAERRFARRRPPPISARLTAHPTVPSVAMTIGAARPHGRRIRARRSCPSAPPGRSPSRSPTSTDPFPAPYRDV